MNEYIVTYKLFKNFEGRVLLRMDNVTDKDAVKNEVYEILKDKNYGSPLTIKNLEIENIVEADF